jgi:hypothetical protein
MRPTISVGLGIMTAAFFVPSFSGSQELLAAGGAPVVAGVYKPLTIWDSISLGASYYTNPQRATSTNVAYSFDGPEFSDAMKSNALWELAKQGKIFFGISVKKDKNQDSISVVPLQGLQQLFAVNSAADLTRVLAKDNVFVIYTDKMLLGEDSKKPVVKTEPKAVK